MNSSLNRSMSSVWGSHRAKINLNSPLPPSPGESPLKIPSSSNSFTENTGQIASQKVSNEAKDKKATKDGELSEPPTITNGKRKARQPPPSSSEQQLPSTSNSVAKRTKITPKPSLPQSGLEKYPPPAHTLASLGGLQNTISSLLELVAMPLLHPEIYVETGVNPPRGVLLTGPPGCGKTALAGGLAGTLELPFISVSAPSIVSGMSGESEGKLREVFEEAKTYAPSILFLDELDSIAPKRDSAQREMEKRIVAQLLTCLDDLSWHIPPPNHSPTEPFTPKPVIVLAATNRPDALDAALRRAGRFDNEITLGVPDAGARESILRTLTMPLRLSADVDLRDVAGRTPGYVGADLAALVAKAGVGGVKRIWHAWSDGILEGTAMAMDGAETRGMGVNEELRDADREEDGMVVDTEQQTQSLPTPEKPAEKPDVLPATSLAPALLLSASPGPEPESTAETTPKAHSTSLAFNLPYLPTPTLRLLTDRSPISLDLLRSVNITQADFLIALPAIQPSSTREGFSSVPQVRWSAVGGLSTVREDLMMGVVAPIRFPEMFRGVGVGGGGGVLLWGPPGCGKTLLARATAGECRANFVCVRGPEVVNKYVGESERALRQIFSRARASAPCVIFFDEIDSLVPRRDDQLSESSARIVNTFLTELDSLDPSSAGPSSSVGASEEEKDNRSVYVIGATNRPDILDPAMVRPGRLDKLLYVDLPDERERVDIVRAVLRTRGVPLAVGGGEAVGEGVERIVRERCDGFSGADLASLVREAGVVALKRALASRLRFSLEYDPDSNTVVEDGGGKDGEGEGKEKVVVTLDDFEKALGRVSPSVSAAQRRKYEALRSRFSSGVAS